MADRVSSGDREAAPSKRKRILKPSAVVPVPVYSSRVSSCLQLKPAACLLPDSRTAADDLWAELTSGKPPAPPVEFSDESDDESEPQQNQSEPSENQREDTRCPSPPPPESPVQKQSNKAKRKLSEINRKLRAVSSILSPEPQNRRSGRGRTRLSELEQDDDVIIVGPVDGSDSLREIPLKIRCRTDVHKVLVLPSTRLSDVVRQLSAILQAPPPRLLLLKEEAELPTDATVGQLGLGIADIIECLVIPAEEQSSISIKLQGKDRDSSQEFSIHREAPLSSIFSQYLSSLPAGAHRKARFHFDGSAVTGSQTAAQLDMEDGDIIEVWT